MTLYASSLRHMLAPAVALALGFSTAVWAQAPAAPPLNAEAAAVKKGMEQKFPGMDIRQVTKTNYGGLYEVVLPDQIVYTDAKTNFVLIGQLFDTAAKQNVTEARLRDLNRVPWDSLPLQLAMKKVKGTGERKLAVFSDADCPFCAKLEQELKTIDNVTIYTFLYPIDQLHPDAARKSKMIWCAPDRQRAWDEFFVSGKLPDNKGDCGDPVAATAALGQKMNVTATPTLVFADGSLIPGALPAQRLEAQFLKAEADVKKAAAKK